MAWTAKQIKEARSLYKRKGNRLTWPECIAKATAGAKPKRVAGKAAKKVVVKKTVVTRKATTRAKSVSGDATGELVRVTKLITQKEQLINGARGKSVAGMSAGDKARQRADIAAQKKYLQTLKQYKNQLKRSI